MSLKARASVPTGPAPVLIPSRTHEKSVAVCASRTRETRRAHVEHFLSRDLHLSRNQYQTLRKHCACHETFTQGVENEPQADSRKPWDGGWLIGVIPSFPAENQQVILGCSGLPKSVDTLLRWVLAGSRMPDTSLSLQATCLLEAVWGPRALMQTLHSPTRAERFSF